MGWLPMVSPISGVLVASQADAWALRRRFDK
jgi:hypothetical protein